MKTPATANIARFVCVLAFPLSGITSTLPAEASFERAYSDRDSHGAAAIQTRDGGFVVAGDTDFVGHPDFYLLKTDAAGNLLWETSFGHRGDGDDSANDVIELADGRLVLIGVSDRGDLGPVAHGVYVVTTDANGELQWEATYGGWGGREVTISGDGNLVVAGSNTADDSHTIGGGTDWDMYVVKFSPDGELIWRKNIDASPHDWASSIQSAPDGGYYVLGTTRPSQGDEDVLLVKTDADGNPEWQKTFGTPDWQESGISLRVTPNGGLILATNRGINASFEWDIQLIRTDALGDTEWREVYVRSGKDFVSSVTPTADGGFAFTGRGASEGGWNALLVQVDATGDVVAEGDFGGEEDDRGNSIEQTGDGGFIVSGTSRSFTAPDVYDNQVYLIKTAPEDVPAPIFRRGDCNSDGELDISDPLCVLNGLFAGVVPNCRAATNANGDTGADISDAVYLLNHLFAVGPSPAAPYPDCGTSELTADEELGCETPPKGCGG